MSWAGKLLVATPELTEGAFARSVVLLLQHGESDGALGVVVNRPTSVPVGSVLPPWSALVTPPDVLFEGGPVQPDAAICLGRLRPGQADGGPAFVPLDSDPTVGTVDLDADPALVVPCLQGLRVFAGYAGWSPGQLEGEVEAGGWWVLEALPGDAFAVDPAPLWRQVLRRQGMPLALVSTAPLDPSLN